MDMDMGMATGWHAPVGERGVGDRGQPLRRLCLVPQKKKHYVKKNLRHIKLAIHV
jgi:hypothetical protein